MKLPRFLSLALKWLGRIALAASTAFLLLIGLLFWQQEAVVQQALAYANASLPSQVTLAGSHISPFANFPYISIDLEGVKVYETKDTAQAPLAEVADVYLGFDLWTILDGQYQVKAITLKNGTLKVIQHPDGSFNWLKALGETDTTATDEAEAAPFKLDLKRIELRHLDLHKISEVTNTDVDAYVDRAMVRVAMDGAQTHLSLDSRFEMNLILDGDTTYLKHKHVSVKTEVDYDGEQQRVVMAPSELKLEGAAFQIEGSVDLADAPYLDLKLAGTKPNFDLLIAFAPDDLIPTLRQYDNRGEVFFEAEVRGSIAEGAIPGVEARFGCAKGLIKNNQSNRSLQDMGFEGYLHIAENGRLEEMEFGLRDFRAKPETGTFSGDLRVRNFASPDIELQLRSQFDLNFLVDFFNLEGLSDLSGSVGLTMNFHDIINLDQPEKSIERLNESYFTEVEIRDLSFKSEAFYLPIEGLNVIGHIEGHQAMLDTLSGRVGGSDLFMTGRISDLPAIIHHTKDSVWVDMKLRSDLLDLAELTYDDSLQAPAVDEQIRDLRLALSFTSSAFAFTESPNLPIGEFFIRELYADLQHYPHQLHDFHADVLIEEEDLRLIDFSGELDSSDFHFTGRLTHYDRWMADSLNGDTDLEFDLSSRRLRLEDLLVYQGENYVPEDYRHEDVRNLALRGRSALHFQANELRSIDLYLDELAGKMQLHDASFEGFQGRLHFEDEHLTAENFRGRIGASDFGVDLYWYLGDNPQLRKEDHRVALRAQRLNLNQLLAWNEPPGGAATLPDSAVDHDAAFSLFDLPFWDMTVRADIDHLSYHSYQIDDLHAALRMSETRFLHLDTCHMRVADGRFDIKGYFDATDSANIYLLPEIKAQHVDLDQFMVKFDNFGQDYLVSDNLHGYVNCDLSGKLHLHHDLTPMLEASELDIDLEVLQGRLDHYEPMSYLADYFADKNLNRIRFDTLRNTFRLRDNVLTIPAMAIHSSLGFLELWGTQSLADDFAMDLSVKIPLSLVKGAVFSKLFKRKREEVDPEQEDAIVYPDPDKKVGYTYVQLLTQGDDYEVKLLKKGQMPE